MKYIVVDLEATCWESNKDKHMEIIEIGAVKLNEKYEKIDTFQAFVKPILNPTLTTYCKQLTTIKQEDVDSASIFNAVLTDLRVWLGGAWAETIAENLFCSWGRYDRNQLIEDCILHRQIFPFNNKHINIKSVFVQIMKVKHCGMCAALNILNMEREGPVHRGLSDAINTARIFKRIKEGQV